MTPCHFIERTPEALRCRSALFHARTAAGIRAGLALLACLFLLVADPAAAQGRAE
jgi:hypothetical protein